MTLGHTHWSHYLSLEHECPNHIQGLSLGSLNHPGPQWNANSLVEDWSRGMASWPPAFSLKSGGSPRAREGLSPLFPCPASCVALSGWDDGVGLCTEFLELFFFLLLVLENGWGLLQEWSTPAGNLLSPTCLERVSIFSPRDFVSMKRHNDSCKVLAGSEFERKQQDPLGPWAWGLATPSPTQLMVWFWVSHVTSLVSVASCVKWGL